MNDTFNLHRFSLLFKKTILERPTQLLGLIALIMLISLTLFSICVYFGGWTPGHLQAFIWGYIGGGTILASVIFSYFNTNASGSAYLILPASVFEKWLCGILIAGVLFTCLFLGFYRLMDICFVTIYHNRLDKNMPHYIDLYDKAQIFAFDGRIPQISYMLFANFAGAALLGSLYFNRSNLIKTTVLVCCILLGIFALNFCIAKILFTDIGMAAPLSMVDAKVGNEYRVLRLPANGQKAVEASINYIIPAILWITAYICIREKEI